MKINLHLHPSLTLGKVKKLLEKTVLALIIALALLGSLPIPVKADSSAIDLKLGGEGATSWSIANVYPGQKGTKTITLYNAGYLDGFVTIWITDIKETDFAGNGAWLDDYVLFDVSSDRLSTNLGLPLKIDKFPQDAPGNPNYLRINSLKAGETITLLWRWHFLSEAGNKAQGDGFSFTINYKLEGIPPPSGSYWEESWEEPAEPVVLPPPEPELPQQTPAVPPVTPIPPTPVDEINWLLIGRIAAGLLVVSGITYFLIKRRRMY